MEGTSNLFLDKSASLKHGQSTPMHVYHRCHLAFPFERDQREGEGEREREMGGIWGFVCFIVYLLKGLCGIASAAKILPIAIALAKTAAIYGCLAVLKSIPGLLHTPPLLFCVLLSTKFTNVYKYWKDYFVAVREYSNLN
jgi:hypothetical protein